MTMLNSVLASSLQVLDIVVIMLVTPVVAFYLLLDWDSFVAKIDSLLPRRNAGTVRRLAHEIDVVLAGFVRGQSAVCLVLGTFYAVALMTIGLPFGFLVGIVAGLISFIPFVGSFVGGVLSIGIAIFTFWEDPIWILVVAGIFGFGQFVEGNILSPNLIGKSVGLHPVILILALSVFGALFGFAGLLVAVPLAAAIGVLGRFATRSISRARSTPGCCRRAGRPCRPKARCAARRAAAPGRQADPALRRVMRGAGQLALDLPSRPALGRADVHRRARQPPGAGAWSTAGRAGRAGGWRWRGLPGRARPTSRTSGRRGPARGCCRPRRCPGSTSGPGRGDAALVVEDADRLEALGTAAARSAEEALFHLCNRLGAGGGALMVSGRSAPASWRLATARPRQPAGGGAGGGAGAAGRRAAGGGAGQAVRRPRRRRRPGADPLPVGADGPLVRGGRAAGRAAGPRGARAPAGRSSVRLAAEVLAGDAGGREAG